MLWIKAFHIIFMVTWFAGLFYLPRLFVYHVLVKDIAGRERFCMMERKLFAIMSIGAVGTVVFGLWLLTKIPADLGAGWMHAKLTLVVVLFGYHIWLGMLCRRFRNNLDSHGHVFYRWINEIPALFLITIVILAVVKPF